MCNTLTATAWLENLVGNWFVSLPSQLPHFLPIYTHVCMVIPYQTAVATRQVTCLSHLIVPIHLVRLYNLICTCNATFQGLIRLLWGFVSP